MILQDVENMNEHDMIKYFAQIVEESIKELKNASSILRNAQIYLNMQETDKYVQDDKKILNFDIYLHEGIPLDDFYLDEINNYLTNSWFPEGTIFRFFDVKQSGNIVKGKEKKLL